MNLRDIITPINDLETGSQQVSRLICGGATTGVNVTKADTAIDKLNELKAGFDSNSRIHVM